jgi:sugar phosphate isomerase/epimerase
LATDKAKEFNEAAGGAKPVAVLKKYPGRALTIHIKPNGGGPEAAIGEDKVDWIGVFGFCESKGGTRWYVVEHETSKDPIDAVKRKLRSAQEAGKGLTRGRHAV